MPNEPEGPLEADKPSGRPSKYSEKLAKRICDAISTSALGLADICAADAALPDERTVYRWLAKNSDFCQRYARAKELQAAIMAEEILAIADDGRNDWMTIKRGDTEIEVVNREAVMRSDLRVETRKWLLSKLLPKKYGDKLAVEHDVSNELADRMLEAQKRLDASK